ncbi:MAG: CoA-binding protein [Actinomycetota bacterium]|nr:CoA-binding protein [Actinomycetota bacterium]
MAGNYSDPAIAREILEKFKRFAVVGCSSDPRRASFRVSRYLMLQGYEVTPVNPHESQVHGQAAYPDLASVPHPLEVVDIFRRADEAGTHIDEAIDAGAKAVWMQLDVIDEQAAERAHQAGLLVVMDRCPAIDHPAFFGS